MHPLHYFSPQPKPADIPARLIDPFDNDPDALARRASKLLQERIQSNTDLTAALLAANGGKMFGVLVVRDETGQIGYLAGFSGQLLGQWLVAGFVPPICDSAQLGECCTREQRRVDALSRQINAVQVNPARVAAHQQLSLFERQQQEDLMRLKHHLQQRKSQRHQLRRGLDNSAQHESIRQSLSRQSQHDREAFKQRRQYWEQRIRRSQQYIDSEFEGPIRKLKQQRQGLSRNLQLQHLDCYRLTNSRGENVTLRSLFDGKTPPAGTGDCATPKLLHLALANGLKPLALAEFWWGAPATEDVRHHGFFYPPCRGKCRPLLRHQLKGIALERRSARETALEPDIVYEDDELVVVNKPSGLLSVPGKDGRDSVQDWLRQRYAQRIDVRLVHRLDMSTSGLLLAAKQPGAHKRLQKQFSKRLVGKRYVAILCRPLGDSCITIDLPLRVDIDDRPRQRVCYQHGKQAVTRVEVISTDANSSRVYFYPLTGRTHQLRVHAAHPLGLNAPICGDELYGARANRLMLHAEQLTFQHPSSGTIIELEAAAPF